MTNPSEFPLSFVEPWKALLLSRQKEQLHDFPNDHASDPGSLITTSSPQKLYVGTGLSVLQHGILPAILDAKSSVHFVTCYWAASPSLEAIKGTLIRLAEERRDAANTSPPLRVTIGFSTWGLLQKLFHTSSTRGQTYSPSQWAKLGLPGEDVLSSGGIQLTVKSLFFTPISVMHPKYVIIDGYQVFAPSCNISWEKWFEGCVELQGAVVQNLLAFHRRVWMAEDDLAHAYDVGDHATATSKVIELSVQDATASDSRLLSGDDSSATRVLQLAGSPTIPTIVLPSPHHRNPKFSIFPFLSGSEPPMTPLNAALLTLFANARHRITILTPNVTSWPVLDALLHALDRGVDVRIRTNQGMMLIEQLITAGTTTSLCLKKFVSKYEQLKARKQCTDTEEQSVSPGTLNIQYYKPVSWRLESEDEPVFSHFKMTMVDNEFLVLGSGNMDRASWWTSQELGFLFHVPGFDWQHLWDSVLDKRMELFYAS
ncbi:IQ calmodulin-binding motif protein [Moelleriella libera RCEF 2490]|uniref:IQ calmodulin-binding motif protein n=1 Tax=Moelleriella libera RCEF 2490 TaxID=1081109 RepID=A0A168F5R0_9HYPO|nr:IQ calmodulin-binding motif protein [Moelleriella libera RCEF 2490]